MGSVFLKIAGGLASGHTMPARRLLNANRRYNYSSWFAGSPVVAERGEPSTRVALSVELLVIRPLKTDTRLHRYLHRNERR